MQKRLALLTSVAALATTLWTTTAPARADISVDAGAFGTNGAAAFGGAVSLGVLRIPVISAELTGAFPAGAGGGYAATFDVRAGLFGTAIGAGAGVGTLGDVPNAGVIYDALLAHDIAPHTALEVREYLGPERRSSFFGGLRFTL